METLGFQNHVQEVSENGVQGDSWKIGFYNMFMNSLIIKNVLTRSMLDQYAYGACSPFY